MDIESVIELPRPYGMYHLTSVLAYPAVYISHAEALCQYIHQYFDVTLQPVFDGNKVNVEYTGSFCSMDRFRHTCVAVVVSIIARRPLLRPPESLDAKRCRLERHLAQLFAYDLLAIAYLDLSFYGQWRN